MITEASPGRLMAEALVVLGLGTKTVGADWKTLYGTVTSEPPTRRIGVMSATPITHGKDPDGDLSQHLGVQVVVRAKTREEGEVKCLRIIARLMQVKPQAPVEVTLDAVVYEIRHVVLASGPILVTTEENKDAEVHSVNFLFVAEVTG